MNKPLIYLGCNSNLYIFNAVCKQHGIVIHGIVDDDYWGNTAEYCGVPVVGGESSFDFESAQDQFDFFIACSVAPTVPRSRAKRLAFIDIVNQHNLTCCTLRDKDSRVYEGVVIEPGSFIGFQASISPYAIVKSHSQINGFAALGHNATLGQNSVLERRVLVAGDVVIGNNVHLGAGVICINHAGITIGDNSQVQPGIILMRDVDTDEVVSIGGKNTRRIYKNVIRD